MGKKKGCQPNKGNFWFDRPTTYLFCTLQSRVKEDPFSLSVLRMFHPIKSPPLELPTEYLLCTPFPESWITQLTSNTKSTPSANHFTGNVEKIENTSKLWLTWCVQSTSYFVDQTLSDPTNLMYPCTSPQSCWFIPSSSILVEIHVQRCQMLVAYWSLLHRQMILLSSSDNALMPTHPRSKTTLHVRPNHPRFFGADLIPWAVSLSSQAHPWGARTKLSQAWRFPTLSTE